MLQNADVEHKGTSVQVECDLGKVEGARRPSCPPCAPPTPAGPITMSHACLRPGGVGLAARVNVTGKPQTVAWLIKVVRKRPEAQRLVGAAVEGVDDKTAAKYAAEAHNFCPYSKAIAGNIDVQVAASGTS